MVPLLEAFKEHLKKEQVTVRSGALEELAAFGYAASTVDSQLHFWTTVSNGNSQWKGSQIGWKCILGWGTGRWYVSRSSPVARLGLIAALPTVLGSHFLVGVQRHVKM